MSTIHIFHQMQIKKKYWSCYFCVHQVAAPLHYCWSIAMQLTSF